MKVIDFENTKFSEAPINISEIKYLLEILKGSEE